MNKKTRNILIGVAIIVLLLLLIALGIYLYYRATLAAVSPNQEAILQFRTAQTHPAYETLSDDQVLKIIQARENNLAEQFSKDRTLPTCKSMVIRGLLQASGMKS